MRKNKETTFIQIASYRDPELSKTIKDCLDKADNPEDLYFGIAWQHSKEDEWDDINEYKTNPNFRIIDINYKDSQGVGWARNKLQRLYSGETYTLQLDSHHRFAQGWDSELKHMLKSLQEKGHPKPLLTGYIPGYFPDKDPEGRMMEPWQLNMDRFAPEGPIHSIPSIINKWELLEGPIPARFYSAHFAFTLGRFVHEVPHDPDIYFHGEESSIAIRAYTHGYDLFHPHKVIIWHEYGRERKSRHWDDNSRSHQLNQRSFKKYRALFGIENESKEEFDFVGYGLGEERSLEDWEKYTGIDIVGRRVHIHTLEGKILPIPFSSDEEYEKNMRKFFKYCIDIDKNQLPEPDYDAWIIAFKDKEGNEIARADVGEKELKQIQHSCHDGIYRIWRSFYYEGNVPVSYLLWPHTKSKEYNNPIIENKFA